MAVLLAHRDHGVLACRHSFLADRPIARDISRVHPWIIWTLQFAFVARTLLELTRTVGSRRDAPQIEGVGCCAVTDDCLALAQELVANAELERCFLLNRWSVKHLVFKGWKLLGYCSNFAVLFDFHLKFIANFSLNLPSQMP